MSRKFHVGKNGPGPCSATIGKCPYGGEDSHFSTIVEAEANFKEKMIKEHQLIKQVDEFLEGKEERFNVNNISEGEKALQESIKNSLKEKGLSQSEISLINDSLDGSLIMYRQNPSFLTQHAKQEIDIINKKLSKEFGIRQEIINEGVNFNFTMEDEHLAIVEKHTKITKKVASVINKMLKMGSKFIVSSEIMEKTILKGFDIEDLINQATTYSTQKIIERKLKNENAEKELLAKGYTDIARKLYTKDALIENEIANRLDSKVEYIKNDNNRVLARQLLEQLKELSKSNNIPQSNYKEIKYKFKEAQTPTEKRNCNIMMEHIGIGDLRYTDNPSIVNSNLDTIDNFSNKKSIISENFEENHRAVLTQLKVKAKTETQYKEELNAVLKDIQACFEI